MDIFYPIQIFANLVTDWLGLAKGSYLESAVNFFIYDTIKIGLLLVAINYLMAIVRYYFPTERARDILTKKRWFGLNYLMAALLGVVTPFCSCSSIPLFIGFVGAGIPLGIVFAFLISSPLINESSLYLFPAMFGLKVTILYNLFGLAIAIVGGMLIQRLKVERYIMPEFLELASHAGIQPMPGAKRLSFSKLASHFWKEGMGITKKIFPYVVLGVAIGAAIHGFVPSDMINRYAAGTSWWTVPFVVALGAPLYANSVSVLPIMEAMVGKGVPLGTALAFMTAIVTLSIPEMLILKKVMRWHLLAIFFGITTIGIILMGYVFNAVM